MHFLLKAYTEAERSSRLSTHQPHSLKNRYPIHFHFCKLFGHHWIDLALFHFVSTMFEPSISGGDVSGSVVAKNVIRKSREFARFCCGFLPHKKSEHTNSTVISPQIKDALLFMVATTLWCKIT